MRGYYQEGDELEDDDGVSALQNQIFHFHTSDQHERVLSVGAQLLSKDPQNSWVHSLMGQAHTALEQYAEAEKQLRAAIALEPDDGATFGYLAFMELQRGRAGAADDHIRQSIKLDPTNTYSWYIFGILCVHYRDFKQAQICVEKIRTLDPESSLAETLDVRSRSEIDGKNQFTLEEKITENERLLADNPEDDFVHFQLGYIHLDETKDIEKAEFHFRKALEGDPADKDYQKGLIKSWRKRDWFLKFLWIPYLPIQWALQIGEWCNKQLWPYLFMIFLFKYILLIGVIVALIFFTIFWPVAKVYEYLTLAEIHRKMGVLKMYNGVMEKVHKWPYSKRMLLLGGVILLYWGGIALTIPYLVDSEVAGASLTFLIFGLCSLFIILSWLFFFLGGIKKFRRSSKNKTLNT